MTSKERVLERERQRGRVAAQEVQEKANAARNFVPLMIAFRVLPKLAKERICWIAPSVLCASPPLGVW